MTGPKIKKLSLNKGINNSLVIIPLYRNNENEWSELRAKGFNVDDWLAKARLNSKQRKCVGR